jgi:hypothetical protein
VLVEEVKEEIDLLQDLHTFVIHCPEPFRATTSPHHMPPSTLNSMGKIFIPPQPWNTKIYISTPVTNG